MIPSTQPLSPLRQRMLEDMRMRKLEPRTQEAYIRAVRKLAAYLKRSPDAATVEDLRNFQLHLVDTGSSPMTLNATLTGLKFFFDITLGRIELMAKMQPVKLPRTLPVVLSCEEVSRLLAAARNIKHQVALSVAYGAGLRASEVVSLRVCAPPLVFDVDAPVPVDRGGARMSPRTDLYGLRNTRKQATDQQCPRPRPHTTAHWHGLHTGCDRQAAARIPIAFAPGTPALAFPAVSSPEACATPALRPWVIVVWMPVPGRYPTTLNRS